MISINHKGNKSKNKENEISEETKQNEDLV